MYLRTHSSLMALSKQLIRYVWVGLAMSALYISLTSAIIELFGLIELGASVAAFAITLPAAYFAHRHITFEARGSHVKQSFSFFVTMMSAFVISTVSMALVVHVAHWHYAASLLITTVLVPIGNFIALRFWVFR